MIRIDLAVLSGEGPPDIHDVTVACIGECNYKYTGPRDGKTLHRFLTAALLKKAGHPLRERILFPIRIVYPARDPVGRKLWIEKGNGFGAAAVAR